MTSRWEDCSATQLLDADPEPRFVADLSTFESDPFGIVFANKALSEDDGLYDQIRECGRATAEFWAWVRGLDVDRDQEYDFATRSWIRWEVDQKWVVISSRQSSPAASRNGSLNRTRSDVMRKTSETPNGRAAPTSGLLFNDSSATSATLNSMSNTRLDVFHKMLEMTDVGVFEYHPSGVLLHANEAFYRLSGHPRELEKHQAFSWIEAIFPEDAELAMSQWLKLAQGTSVSFELRWKSQQPSLADREKIGAQWVVAACVPVLDSAGIVMGIAGNMIDISAQKRQAEEATKRTEALERARQSEKLFARFAELAPVGICIFKADGALEYCNDEFRRITGHELAIPEPVDWTAIVHEDDLLAIPEGWKGLLEDKRLITTQVRLKRCWTSADGKDHNIWMQSIAHPELYDDGNIKSIMATVVDISQFKFAESLQKLRVEEALEAKRQQENFIDMTSHEMRNPLSAVVQCADSTISSLMDMLNTICILIAEKACTHCSQELEAVRQEIQNSLDAVQTIVSCSTHQKRIIDDVLTLSKLDSNLLLITPVKVQIMSVLSEAMKMFELECSKADIQLQFQGDASLSLAGFHGLMLDPSRLIQVLINLLTNAIKFTQGRAKREINVTVGISTERPTESSWDYNNFSSSTCRGHDVQAAPEWGLGRKMYLWVSVQDTGRGLNPEQQSSLFTRFKQATPRTHVQYGGSGLGLFISRSLTELQGGEIGVKSEAGVGSTFSFFVGTRLATAASLEVVDDDDDSQPQESFQQLEDRVRAAHYSVLIVEDNLVNQKVLAKQLQKIGCIVHIADHGLAALDFLKTTSLWKGKEETGTELDVILLDQEMPVMGGLECARQIRAFQENGSIVDHIPILGVSANARAEQVQNGLASGMDDAITKPYRIPELLPKVDRLVREWRS